MLKYIIHKDKILASESFRDGRADELRVLLSLIATGGTAASEDELANIAAISRPRLLSALALWCAERVISEEKSDPCRENGSIVEEFEERIRAGEIPEIPAVDAARSVRDESLGDMIAMIGEMLGTAALPRESVKRITTLVTELALTPEYIVTLASYMKDNGKLTVTRLTAECERLTRRGIDNTEALEAYIKDATTSTAAERELRRMFGIYDRAITPTMKKYFLTWTEDMGFGTEIIAAAYDISATSTGKLALAHINKILEGWQAAGCVTLADCRAEAERMRASGTGRFASKTERPKARVTPDKPKYGSFDINDAFKKALERSYGKDED